MNMKRKLMEAKRAALSPLLVLQQKLEQAVTLTLFANLPLQPNPDALPLWQLVDTKKRAVRRCE
jgi:hypothetical protein